MTENNDDTAEGIARAWIDLQKEPYESKARDQLFWSFDALYDLVQKDPEGAWAIIQMIRSLDGSDHVLANLAAGPVEDLIAKHWERFIDRFEVLAQSDEQFRKILGAVWQRDIPDDIWNRIRSVAALSW